MAPQVKKIPAWCFVLAAVLVQSICHGAKAGDLAAPADVARPELMIARKSDGNTVSVYQSGESNLAEIQQSHGVDNLASLWQSGVMLRASVEQNGTGNELHANQSELSNDVTIRQVGAGNALTVDQYGSGNSFLGEQLGDDNSATLTLHGGSNVSILQQGNQNMIVADQPAGLSMRIEQVGDNLQVRLVP
jgi:hypothetical protein